MSPRLPVFGLVVALSLLAGRPARAQSSPPPERYFYFGYDYGSQSLYSPWWVFINRGWDVLQDHVADRNVLELEYRHNAANVLRNMANPFPAIRERGCTTSSPRRSSRSIGPSTAPAGCPTTACI